MSTSQATSAGTLLADDELARLRAQMPAVTGCVFMNAGSVGPMPLASVEAQRAMLERDAARRLRPRLFEELVEQQQLTREAVASLVGVDAAQVALTHTTHAGMNAALWGLGLRSGDSIVTTDQEHPGVLMPLRALRDRVGVEVRVVPWPPGSNGADLVRGIEAACDSTTAAVALSHVSWTTGEVAPLRDIATMLAGRARLVVDGAQGAGAVALDPGDGWDAYAMSGQKWLLGPNGSGALVLAEPGRWQPTYGGFFLTVDPMRWSEADLQPGARRLEHSVEAELPLAGLAASVDFLRTQVGVARAGAHSVALNARARGALAPLLADGSIELVSGMAHLLCMRMPGRAAQVYDHLASEGIFIRALGPDLARLSLGFWNTPAEVDRACAAITTCLGRSPVD